jgi:hypothetical protein
MKLALAVILLSFSYCSMSQKCDTLEMKSSNILIDSIIKFEQEGRIFDTHVIWTREQFDQQFLRYDRLSAMYYSCLLKMNITQLPDFFIVYYASIIADHCDITKLEELMIENINNSKPVFVQLFRQPSTPLNVYLSLIYYNAYESCRNVKADAFSMKPTIDHKILYNDTIPTEMRCLMLKYFMPNITDRERLLSIFNKGDFDSAIALAALTKLNVLEDIEIVDSLLGLDAHRNVALSIAIVNPNHLYYQTIIDLLVLVKKQNLQSYDEISLLTKIYAYLVQMPSEKTCQIFEENLSRRSGLKMKRRKNHKIALTLALEKYPDPIYNQIKRKHKLKYKQWMDMYQY